MRQLAGVELLQPQRLLAGTPAAHHLAQRRALRLAVVPQRERLAVVLQQQAGGAGEGVGQRVAHGPAYCARSTVPLL